MQRTADSLIFSPSDLNHYLECAHMVRLDLAREPGTPRGPRDPQADLLAAKGQAHEEAWLQRFVEQGKRVATIDPPAAHSDGDPGPRRDWEADAARTRAAMHDGADVIYQGVFADGDWHGVSDFLVKVDGARVEGRSAIGDWHYEAWDTKLARRTKPYFVLQLCYYTEQLAHVQGLEPRDMVVVLGTGRLDRLRYRDFDAYYRKVRGRFLDAVARPRDTYPYPNSHCGFCDYRARCERQWEQDDHPSLVAGIRREQVERLRQAGIYTTEQLAAVSPTTHIGVGTSTLARLRHQAALQTDHRRTGVHRYELLEADETTGFRLLPKPSGGDVFFDIEGDPLFEPARGLEYLWGVLTVDGEAPTFHAFRAVEHGRERQREKEALEDFIDLVHARLAIWPDLHVYHYGSYEVSSLKRLAADYATREDALDDLLRREVFVDLYQVVRQSLRLSHRSYSIKSVRSFFMPEAGQGEVSRGDDSIVQFERWRDEQDPALLQAIVDYNEEDCVSTVRLRDWLLDRRGEVELRDGVTLPWKAVEPPRENERRDAEDAATARRREALLALGDRSDGDTPEARLLADLVGYHRREGKPAWWAYFERRKKSLDQLVDDTDAIALLEPARDAPPEPDRRSMVHTLVFPEQEHKLRAGQDVEDPIRGVSAGRIVDVDDRARRVRLRRGPGLADVPLPTVIAASKPIDDRAQREALARVSDVVLAGAEAYGAVRALLARDVPRITSRLRGSKLQTMDLEDQRELVAGLDGSYLFLQGPPGSGKTYTGARLITSLIAVGKRVGVAALSHKAINNLLEEVERVAQAERLQFTGLKKGSDEDDALGGQLIQDTTKNEDCEAGSVTLVAGTSWLFARQGMDSTLDYLFIDEAGQLSLADTVAMGTCARNLVLLGDPQQLPQIRQGTHPDGAGVSSLEHLLGDDPTVPEDRGIFQERTFRMHPDVCAFVSELAYDGRLGSAEGLDSQQVESRDLSGAGLRYVPVEHSGNAQQSTEEAEAIAAHVRTLLDGGTFTDHAGQTRPLTPQDILVVAPYNMQVARLRDALPDGVEAGTIHKFQGREAPVVFFSMASSSGEDVPRGLEFLFNRNALNVAISRARALAVVVCSPSLLDARCSSVEQMRLTNNLCRFTEQALCVS
jgi:uncharacterized protein